MVRHFAEVWDLTMTAWLQGYLAEHRDQSIEADVLLEEFMDQFWESMDPEEAEPTPRPGLVEYVELLVRTRPTCPLPVPVEDETYDQEPRNENTSWRAENTGEATAQRFNIAQGVTSLADLHGSQAGISSQPREPECWTPRMTKFIEDKLAVSGDNKENSKPINGITLMWDLYGEFPDLKQERDLKKERMAEFDSLIGKWCERISKRAKMPADEDLTMAEAGPEPAFGLQLEEIAAVSGEGDTMACLDRFRPTGWELNMTTFVMNHLAAIGEPKAIGAPMEAEELVWEIADMYPEIADPSVNGLAPDVREYIAILIGKARECASMGRAKDRIKNKPAQGKLRKTKKITFAETLIPLPDPPAAGGPASGLAALQGNDGVVTSGTGLVNAAQPIVELASEMVDLVKGIIGDEKPTDFLTDELVGSLLSFYPELTIEAGAERKQPLPGVWEAVYAVKEHQIKLWTVKREESAVAQGKAISASTLHLRGSNASVRKKVTFLDPIQQPAQWEPEMNEVLELIVGNSVPDSVDVDIVIMILLDEFPQLAMDPPTPHPTPRPGVREYLECLLGIEPKTDYMDDQEEGNDEIANETRSTATPRPSAGNSTASKGTDSANATKEPERWDAKMQDVMEKLIREAESSNITDLLDVLLWQFPQIAISSQVDDAQPRPGVREYVEAHIEKEIMKRKTEAQESKKGSHEASEKDHHKPDSPSSLSELPDVSDDVTTNRPRGGSGDSPDGKDDATTDTDDNEIGGRSSLIVTLRVGPQALTALSVELRVPVATLTIPAATGGWRGGGEAEEDDDQDMDYDANEDEDDEEDESEVDEAEDDEDEDRDLNRSNIPRVQRRQAAARAAARTRTRNQERNMPQGRARTRNQVRNMTQALTPAVGHAGAGTRTSGMLSPGPSEDDEDAEGDEDEGEDADTENDAEKAQEDEEDEGEEYEDLRSDSKGNAPDTGKNRKRKADDEGKRGENKRPKKDDRDDDGWARDKGGLFGTGLVVEN